MHRELRSALTLLLTTLVVIGCGGSAPLVRSDAEPQSPLTGRVLSAETGDPISNATVFLAGTTYQDTTDERGTFAFENVPSGSYVIAGNLAGYSPAVKRVLHYAGAGNQGGGGTLPRSSAASASSEQGTVLPLSVGGGTANRNGTSPTGRLDSTLVADLPPATAQAIDAMQAQVQELESRVDLLSRQLRQIREARLGTALLATKEENLKDFKDYFLGQSRGECRLLNPEALTFQQAEEESEVVLRATAEQPLSIVNPKLGYRLQIVLREFRVVDERPGESEAGSFVVGFNPMTPEGESQAKKWRRERLEAYTGSFMHLMRALGAQRVESEGFALESKGTVGQTSTVSYSQQNQKSTKWLRVEDLREKVTNGQRSHIKRLQLSGKYRVTNEEDGSDKTWRLVVKKKGARFTTLGRPLSAETIQKKGYQEFRSVCQLLPTTYFPPQ